jgi:hypothetical protein
MSRLSTDDSREPSILARYGVAILASVLALLLTWYFVKTGRLWPVIAAHVIVDAIGLSALMRTA